MKWGAINDKADKADAIEEQLESIRMKRKLAYLVEQMKNNAMLHELWQDIGGSDVHVPSSVNINFDAQGGSIAVNSGEVNIDNEPELEFQM